MSDDEKLRRMREATLLVLDRMVKAGWIKQLAQGGDIASMEFTKDGDVARNLLRAFLLCNNGRISAEELNSFLRIIVSTPELL